MHKHCFFFVCCFQVFSAILQNEFKGFENKKSFEFDAWNGCKISELSTSYRSVRIANILSKTISIIRIALKKQRGERKHMNEADGCANSA